ncbi:hypothetical protein [Labrys neptuniae]
MSKILRLEQEDVFPSTWRRSIHQNMEWDLVWRRPAIAAMGGAVGPHYLWRIVLWCAPGAVLS